MKQIRENIFETNSSSSHAFMIDPSKHIYARNKEVVEEIVRESVCNEGVLTIKLFDIGHRLYNPTKDETNWRIDDPVEKFNLVVMSLIPEEMKRVTCDLINTQNKIDEEFLAFINLLYKKFLFQETDYSKSEFSDKKIKIKSLLEKFAIPVSDIRIEIDMNHLSSEDPKGDVMLYSEGLSVGCALPEDKYEFIVNDRHYFTEDL